MWMQVMRGAVAALSVAALCACGDGGGAAFVAPLPQPVAPASTASFNLQAAYNYSVTDTTPLAFKVEGLANGVGFRGDGSYEQGVLETVAEFGSQGGALRKLTPVRMSLKVNGQELKVESVGQDFYTRQELRPLGRLGPAPALEFTEVTRYEGLPMDASVGSHGLVYTASRYTDASRRTLTGTTQASYSVEADASEDSALLVLKVVDQRADGHPGVETTTVLRITRSGTSRRVSETTADASSGTVLKASFL